MSTPVAGKVSELRFAGSEVKGRVDWNFNLDKTEIDGSHMDITGGWSKFLQGRKNATIGGTLRYIEDDAGQLALMTNAFADGDTETVTFKFEEDGQEYSASGFVTNVNPSPPDEDVTNMSFTIRLTGKVTEVI